MLPYIKVKLFILILKFCGKFRFIFLSICAIQYAITLTFTISISLTNFKITYGSTFSLFFELLNRTYTLKLNVQRYVYGLDLNLTEQIVL